MNKILEDIKSARHIELEVNEESLALGSALYTYILTQHKKVSFVCKIKEVNKKYSFLPWFEKLRVTNHSSADLSISLKSSSVELFKALKFANIKINPKMATALYSALILETQNFTNSKTDGTIFAIASELVKSGAQHQKSVQYLVKRATLSELRLKAFMLRSMTLKENAKVAEFIISEDDFKASGATLEDALKIMQEAFTLEYVQYVLLLDENNKIIKTISKEI